MLHGAQADTLVVSRERKGKASDEDVRPGILSVVAAGTVLECELTAQPRALRPSELVRALSPALEETNVRRIAQWIQRDGARSEPLALGLDATDAPPAPVLERA